MALLIRDLKGRSIFMGFQHPRFEASPGVCHSFSVALRGFCGVWESSKDKGFQQHDEGIPGAESWIWWFPGVKPTVRLPDLVNVYSLRTGKLPFIVDIPIKNGEWWFSIVMLVYQRVCHLAEFGWRDPPKKGTHLHSNHLQFPSKHSRVFEYLTNFSTEPPLRLTWKTCQLLDQEEVESWTCSILRSGDHRIIYGSELM